MKISASDSPFCRIGFGCVACILVGTTIYRDKPVVLVVGKGFSAYRGYNLDELYEADRVVWLVDDDDVEPEEQHLVARHVRVDFSQDAQGQAEELIADLDGMSFDVGVCYIEGLLPWAAQFFEALGVTFIAPAQALRVRSKHELRNAFEAAGLPTPRHRRGSETELSSAQIDFPVIIKPEFGFSSIGVELIQSRDELTIYFQRKNNVEADTYVVEGLIDGREYSIEGYSRDGAITASGLTTKFKTPLPFFEELAQFCSRDIGLTDAYRALFDTAVRSLDIPTSTFHFEFFEKNGIRTPVEIGARLAGDKIPYLHRRVSGRSILLDYLGDDVTFPTVGSTGLGIVFFVPKAPGVVAEDFPPDGLAEQLGEHFVEAPAGRNVQVAPDDFFVRLGFCLVEADDIETFVTEANRRIEAYEQAAGIALHRLVSDVTRG